VYDLSWWVNRVMWDDFLLRSDANSRLREEGVRGFNRTADGLWVEGAFNVNSTSVAAWRALLYSAMGVEVDGDGETAGAPFARSLRPLAGLYDPATDDFESERATAGYRRLTAAEIDRLAEEIVVQVRRRGPFLSMSDFVNRALLPAAGDADGLRLRGALQAAIDAAGLNQSLQSGAVADSVIAYGEFLRDTFDRTQADNDVDETWYNFERDHLVGDGVAMRGAAGYLTQADVLSRIGPVLQARGDTFRIRAYGSAGSDPDQPAARAWCEVLVQRTHGYVDASDPASALPEELTVPVNTRFGRSFQILSIKWMSADEI
jgi:Arc/MetJ-type ribon-helix-helix transcriptional regulator